MSRRRNSLFSSPVIGTEGVEIAVEMTPVEPLQLSTELIKEHIIMSEFAMLCREPIDGLYAVPSARDRFEWFGLLFVRQNVYAGATLRFTMRLPADFPSKELPTVVFDLSIFHPHVNPITRELDLKRYFVDGWEPDHHHLHHILFIVQRTFLTFDSDPTSCVNAEAAEMLRNDKEAYRVRASELIKKSRSIIYSSVIPDDVNAIRLTPWDAFIHEPLRQRLIGGLTDSQISTLSMLSSLSCGLSGSSLFESRGKCGFSWISPTAMYYMTEPPRPVELDLEIPKAEECSLSAEPYFGTSSDSNRCSTSGNIPEISKLDFSGIDNVKRGKDDGAEEESLRNNSELSNSEGGSSYGAIVMTTEETNNSVRRINGEEDGAEKQANKRTTIPKNEKTACNKNEYIESARIEYDGVQGDTLKIQSVLNSDELGESDL